MKIRISPEAEQDLIEIFDYILADNPLAADKILDVIYREIHHLGEHPKLGRVGRVSGTRELVLSGAPFIVPLPRLARVRCQSASGNGHVLEQH